MTYNLNSENKYCLPVVDSYDAKKIGGKKNNIGGCKISWNDQHKIFCFSSLSFFKESILNIYRLIIHSFMSKGYWFSKLFMYQVILYVMLGFKNLSFTIELYLHI